MLIYDDFRADNEATVRQVLRFLDVDDEPSRCETVEANPTRAGALAAHDELVRRSAVGKGAPGARR